MSTELMVAPVSVGLDRACKNCGTNLSGKYCGECGQRDKHTDPSLHDLAHEFVHEFLHLDGKIVATLKALVLSPGRLSAEFLAGRRGRYIGPVRVYLTFSLLFFLVAAHSPESGKHSVAQSESAKAGVAQVDVTFGNSRTGKVIRKAIDDPELLRHAFLANVSRVMFAIVPLFGLALRLAYHNRKRRYPTFVYFSLHYHAFVFLALTVSSLIGFLHWPALNSAVGYAGLVAVPGYLLLALRRVFGGSWGNTLARMALLAVFYLPCFGICLAVAGAVSLYTL